MASKISNQISMTSHGTGDLTLEEIEDFAATLRSMGAAGSTRVSVRTTYGDRPGESNSTTLSASVDAVEKPKFATGGHISGSATIREPGVEHRHVALGRGLELLANDPDCGTREPFGG